ncbi:MAG: 3-methyl-2-oxobutanoate dehydrogenase subunit beta [Candidatus Thermoplasmatota archaeon]|nr:3-methyl-2-oxobutanoate dehydrogenase subunit beta [Candidatus Thermoplasmatota archaeon]
MKLKELPDEELFTRGHTACAGCGGAIAVRNLMKILGPNVVVQNPACCLLVFGGTYPWVAWKVPYQDVAFENTAACATGTKRALKIRGKDDTIVLGIAGDGGTADIGIQAMSAAAERNEDIIYVMYDNEAYMNTGIQRSGSTPYGAWTTTTPVGKVKAGKSAFKKDVPQIMIAHNVPYVATTTVAHIQDFINKFEKAKRIKGFRYIQVFSPCPTGWRHDTSKTIEISKLAVDTGMWTLYECEYGKFTINRKPKMTPVQEYLKLQGRFRHMTEEDIKKLQDWVTKKWQADERFAQFRQ